MIEKDISWHDCAKAFGFLASVLNHCPSADTASRLRALACDPSHGQSDGNLHHANETMRAYWRGHAETPLETIAQELAVDWTHLFRGLNPKFGPPPPYEGVYREDDGTGIATMLQVKQAYLRHGVSIPETRNDREDYLGYELDFVRYLAERAGLAQEKGNSEEEEVCRAAVSDFIRTHLRWVDAFCGKAVDYVTTGFFNGFLMLLNDTVSESAAHFGYGQADSGPGYQRG